MAKEVRYFRGGEEGIPSGDVVHLRFDEGTLLVEGVAEENAVSELLTYDPRVQTFRAPAFAYRALLGQLLRGGHAVVDHARGYEELACSLDAPHDPFDHQAEAVDAWTESSRRGVVVLPTGSGKSFVAQLVIDAVDRHALVVVPTLDLVDQWHRLLSEGFETDVGMLGGGEHDVRPVTVSTYDSAAIHMDRLGAYWGLLVFDEVHHLPGEIYRQAAESSIAPFRLGLTATFERSDGKHRDIEPLLGPVVYRRGIKDLSGHILADYRVETVSVEMYSEDAERYRSERAIYKDFIRSENVRMSGRHGWRNFLAATNRSERGRRALKAYQNQKQIALGHAAKLDALADLLEEHAEDRTIVFTNDNATVYRISERFLIPSITHQTPVKERGEVLERFNEGRYHAVVTSKVLNEGVDVPEANVAVILSGTGSVREHVQRLGRILRRQEGKQAVLFELVTDDSVETYVSERRREHDAYR